MIVNLLLFIYLLSVVILIPTLFAAANAYWKYEYLNCFDGTVGERVRDIFMSIIYFQMAMPKIS